MLAHIDNCTHVSNPEEEKFLRSKLFDVNMRLFQSSDGYRRVVLAACEHIRWCATHEKSGYKKPHGWSGANAGIPWNIVAMSDGTIMINPHMSSKSGSVKCWSNCGSLTLDEPIEVTRYGSVTVEYFDTNGRMISVSGPLFTAQHEIEHNQGILIGDKE